MRSTSTPSRLGSVLTIATMIAGGMLAFSYFMKSDKPAAHSTKPPPAGQAAGATPNALPPAQVRDRLRTSRNIELDASTFTATVSDLNAALTSVRLKAAHYGDAQGRLHEAVSTDKERYFPMRVRWRGVDMPPSERWTLESANERTARFRWKGDGVTLVRKIETGAGPYQLWSTVSIQNHGSAPRQVRLEVATDHYVPREQEKSGFLLGARSPALSHGLCVWGDDETATRVPRDVGGARSFDDQFLGHGFGPKVRSAGIENTYFANMMAASGPRAERCQLLTSDRFVPGKEDADGTLFETRLVYPQVSVPAGGTHTARTLLYLGPKDARALAAAAHGLPKSVDLGWFSDIAKGLVRLLAAVNGVVGNWGIAIIILTILVRIVFFPLTFKSFQSMARMQRLKPELDRINQLYANEREKRGAAMMELYRKHKINPLGGCLPQLLQMPVWFAFYASLSTNIELYHAPFALWWTDLSAPDKFFVLPLVLGALMFVQQAMTPMTTMDPMQAKIMKYFMPIMVTSFMLFLPAGLCLYMVTNSVLGIAQQRWIKSQMDRKASGLPALAAVGASPGGDTTMDVGSARTSDSNQKRRRRGRT